MVWGRKKRGGVESVDRGLGEELRQQVLFHDDGVAARGGVMCVVVGKRGTGKTTLEIQMAQYISHFPPDQRNRSRLETLHPETIIWRGRGYDYWNSFSPDYWKKYHGWKHPKPLIVHNWVNNEYQFTIDTDTDRVPLSGVKFSPYETCEELISHIVPGAINVVYRADVLYHAGIVYTAARNTEYQV